MAATLQEIPRREERGCYYCLLRSKKALMDATKAGEEQPIISWMPADIVTAETAKRVIATYDLEKEFVLWVSAPDHSFITL